MAFSWNPGALAPTKTPSVPAEKTVGAWPHAGGQLLVGASALTAADVLSAMPAGDPASAAVSALTEGQKGIWPWWGRIPGLLASAPDRPSVSALEGAEPRQAPRFTGGHQRLFAPLLTGHWHGASAPSSALSEAAVPPAGARTGSPAVADRSYLPGNDDNAAAASLSASPSPLLVRRRARLFGLVRAW